MSKGVKINVGGKCIFNIINLQNTKKLYIVEPLRFMPLKDA